MMILTLTVNIVVRNHQPHPKYQSINTVSTVTVLVIVSVMLQLHRLWQNWKSGVGIFPERNSGISTNKG
jgi:hypothetical protein